jgi:hypothetical protein
VKNLYVGNAIGEKFELLPNKQLDDKLEKDILNLNSQERFTDERYTTKVNKHFINIDNREHLNNNISRIKSTRNLVMSVNQRRNGKLLTRLMLT